MIKKLLPYLRRYRLYILLCPVSMLCEVAMEVTIPLLMGRIVDIGIADRNLPYIIETGVWMAVLSLFSLLFGVWFARMSSVAQMGFGRELRGALFHKIQLLSLHSMDQFHTASLVNRMTTDVSNVQNAFLILIRLMTRSLFMMVFATVMAFMIRPGLACVLVAALPVLFLAVWLMARTASGRFPEMLERYDNLNSSVQENLIGIRVVKSFVRTALEKKKFFQASGRLKESQVRAEKVIAGNTAMVQLLLYGCTAVVLWSGGRKIIDGTLLTGELLIFLTYITQIFMTLMMVSVSVVNIALSAASIKRILEVLETNTDISEELAVPGQEVESGGIRFENVCFGYENTQDKMILDHVSFNIEPGESVGIVGGTGCGKSSLVQLIPRFYDVTKGRILVDGKDLRSYSVVNLRKKIGIVLQKNVLFSGTIMENLLWGNRHADREQIIRACRTACADEFIMSLPAGYDTLLGQGGVNLSGGQKQRLCIARALLKNPSILVMDDSTSAVDTATDQKILRSLGENLKDVTTITIAQRISSVSSLDKIIVMDNGRVEAVGTHETLLVKSRIYQELYRSQQKGVA